MRKFLSIALVLLMLVPYTAFAQEQTTTPEATETPVVEAISFNQSLELIKGKHEYINIANVDDVSKIEVKSSDNKVATIDNEGKITAKKCGVATVTLGINDDDISYETNVKVTVSISRNAKTKVYGKKCEVVKSASARPCTNLPVAVKVGGSTKFTVSNLLDSDTVSYQTSDKKIATVDKAGKITTKKVGKATITATVKRDGKTIKCKEQINAVKSISNTKITKKQRNKYYSTSAFIGSSIGIGQRMYFDSQGKNYLGHPLMLVRGCYSFNNDKRRVSKYMIQYKGKTMQAKEAVKKSGVDKVFVAMGTNDLFQGVNTTYDQYIEYIEGIKKKSPKVVIFVESMTSVHASKQKSQLNSKNVAKLNKKLKKYCDSHKDYYYVDVSSRMNDKKGHLMSKYASDNYVHLTNSAYAIWMEELTKYTDKLMIDEQNAEDAVKTAVESKNPTLIKRAESKLKKLDDSKFKSSLKKQLKTVK